MKQITSTRVLLILFIAGVVVATLTQSRDVQLVDNAFALGWLTCEFVEGIIQRMKAGNHAP